MSKIHSDKLLQPLTSCRFLAALCVFLWHAQFLFKYQLGYVGVSFFFVLSGFVLTYRYQSVFATFTKKALYSFYVARFAKIYPVHFLTFLVSIPAVIVVLHLQPAQLILPGITNLLLIQSFIPSRSFYFSFNAVSWSLSNEAFFYLLLPFVLVLLVKLRRLLTVKTLVLVLLVDWGVMVLYLFSKHPAIDTWGLDISPLVRFNDFLTGVMVCELFFLLRPQKMSHKIWSLLESSALALVIFAIFLSPHVPQSLRFATYYLPIWSLLILVLSYQNGVISSLLSAKLLQFLGDVSFSFYMVHYMAVKLFMLPVMMRIAGNTKYAHIELMTGALILAIGLSTFIYLQFEEPARKRIRATFTGRAHLPPGSASTVPASKP